MRSQYSLDWIRSVLLQASFSARSGLSLSISRSAAFSASLIIRRFVMLVLPLPTTKIASSLVLGVGPTDAGSPWRAPADPVNKIIGGRQRYHLLLKLLVTIS